MVLDSSFEDALQRARNFMEAKGLERSRSIGCFSEDCSLLSTRLVSSEKPRTPEEYKRRLQQQRISDVILGSPPGTIRFPSVYQSVCTEQDSGGTSAGLNEDEPSEKETNVSTFEASEEKLRTEAARMRAVEERELFLLYQEADRQAKEEHLKFLQKYRDLQEALDAQSRRDEARIALEITQRRQAAIVKAKRDSELIVQLHKTLSEKSAELEKAFAAKSKQILDLAERAKQEEERAKQEEEKILLQRKLHLLREDNKKKFDEVVNTIEEAMRSLQKELPESQTASEQLLKIKTSLQDPANLENTSILKDALAEMKTVLDRYAQALLEREEKKTEEIKLVPKKMPESNRYVQAVEKLKRNQESFSKFIEGNKALRGNINRFVQLTVNKIQKQTNNQEHALAFVKLFSNDSVPVGIGKDMVCLAGHSDAVAYSMDLTAKKILDNVEKLPSEPIQEWLPHATVVATLWSMSAKFGEIFSDNLVSRCPFLVPLYFEELTEEESSAYITNFVHFKNESWSSFIRRMGYYGRLLGVICTMKPRYGTPFSAGKMWTLMSATVKSEFRTRELAEVSSMVMKSLLETSGHTMKASYGIQFGKFTHLMCTEYFEKLRRVAKNAPSVMCLEIFMKDLIAANGKFTPVA